MTATYPQQSLAQLRLAAQQRADRPSTTTGGFIPDSEWNAYINASYAEYYDILVARYDGRYFAKEQSISTDGTSDSYTLATDFYKLLGVDLAIGSGTGAGYFTLKPFNFSDRNRYVYPNVQVSYGLMSNMRYCLYGSKLWLSPRAGGGQTVQVRYVPRLTQLTADADVADDPAGWLDYVVIDVAIKAMQKEESDPSMLMAQKSALLKRIEDMASNRDATGIRTVRDTQGMNGSGMGGGPFGGYGSW